MVLDTFGSSKQLNGHASLIDQKLLPVDLPPMQHGKHKQWKTIRNPHHQSAVGLE